MKRLSNIKADCPVLLALYCCADNFFCTVLNVNTYKC